MDMRTVLQVPMTKALRNQAEKMAVREGFSSLQEVVRVLLNKLAMGSLSVTIEENAVKLSKKAIKRYDKMIDDIDSGKEPVYVAKDAQDLLDQLHGRKATVQS